MESHLLQMRGLKQQTTCQKCNIQTIKSISKTPLANRPIFGRPNVQLFDTGVLLSLIEA